MALYKEILLYPIDLKYLLAKRNIIKHMLEWILAAYI